VELPANLEHSVLCIVVYGRDKSIQRAGFHSLIFQTGVSDDPSRMIQSEAQNTMLASFKHGVKLGVRKQCVYCLVDPLLFRTKLPDLHVESRILAKLRFCVAAPSSCIACVRMLFPGVGFRGMGGWRGF
jgi:hypothetical protein